VLRCSFHTAKGALDKRCAWTKDARDKDALEERCAWIIGARDIGALDFRFGPGSLRLGAGWLSGGGIVPNLRTETTADCLIHVRPITADDKLGTQDVGQGSPTTRWRSYGFAPGLGRLVKSPDFA
jgi:hypothetical protein